MTKMQDPNEVFRASLSEIPVVDEANPPAIEKSEAWPYPELDRIWVRLQLSPFTRFPNLALTIIDPEGNVVSAMFVVEARERYQSLTMHLRQPPRPGGTYRLEIEVSRDEEVLDRQALPFELHFREPVSSVGGPTHPGAGATENPHRVE